MELKDFVSQTLVQIAEGISEANEQLKDSDAVVNPPYVYSSNKDSIYGSVKIGDQSPNNFKDVQKVEFDVSVTATKGSETKGGIKLGIGSIGLGSEGKSENENSAYSRIQFTIPMVLPHGPKI